MALENSIGGEHPGSSIKLLLKNIVNICFKYFTKKIL